MTLKTVLIIIALWLTIVSLYISRKQFIPKNNKSASNNAAPEGLKEVVNEKSLPNNIIVSFKTKSEYEEIDFEEFCDFTFQKTSKQLVQTTESPSINRTNKLDISKIINITQIIKDHENH